MGTRTNTGSANALVVFRGNQSNHGLAAKFSKIRRKLTSDGYMVSCLSSLNLRETMEGLPWLWSLNCVRHPDIKLDLILRHINWELEILEHVPSFVFEQNETVWPIVRTLFRVFSHIWQQAPRKAGGMGTPATVFFAASWVWLMTLHFAEMWCISGNVFMYSEWNPVQWCLVMSFTKTA